MDHNLLTINTEKTAFIPFTSLKHHLPKYARLSFHGQQCLLQGTCNCGLVIKKVESIKYLGVTLDCNLKWEKHTTTLVKRLRSFIYVFKQLRYILPNKVLKQVYQALVESHITYGILGWGGIYKNVLKRLEVIQKLILKIIWFKKITHSTELLFTETQLFDIRQLYAIKAIYNLSRNDRPLKNQEIDHSYSTRNKAMLIYNLPANKKSQGKRSYEFLVIKIYNIIPHSIKTQKLNYHYKKSVKLWVTNSRAKINKVFE